MHSMCVCYDYCFVFFFCLFCFFFFCLYFFFQAEDGIRYLVRSRGLGDVYKRQELAFAFGRQFSSNDAILGFVHYVQSSTETRIPDDDDDSKDIRACLLYTSDAADERSSVDLGGRRIIKKKKQTARVRYHGHTQVRNQKKR